MPNEAVAGHRKPKQQKNYETLSFLLKVHKRENLFGSDFEILLFYS